MGRKGAEGVESFGETRRSSIIVHVGREFSKLLMCEACKLPPR